MSETALVLVAAIAIGELVLLAWQLWANRHSAIPQALLQRAQMQTERDAATTALGTKERELEAAKRDADAQKKRADAAERIAHDVLAQVVGGDDLARLYNRLLSEATTAAGAAAGRDGGGAPAVVHGPLVDPWAGGPASDPDPR